MVVSATCVAKSALPTCNLRNALPTCSQKPNQIGSMQSKPKRSTSGEGAARIPHVHLCHRGFFAGGFCGVVALAAALAVALAAWGRFFVVVCAGAADCRGRFSRGSASTAASPRSRFLGPAACSPRLAVSADVATRFAPTTELLGRLAPAPPRAGAATAFGADFAATVLVQ